MHVHLIIGRQSDGKPAFEPVHAVLLGESRYRIEFTPGLAYGIAAGDEIELGSDGTYAVVARSGNIAVRVLSTHSLCGNEPELTAQVETIGGRLDGSVDRALTYTIPSSVGFTAIESIFTSFTRTYPKAEWEYGNIYAEDGTPLNWWQNVA
jgi:hypothetical protein